jgi:hypothetical protein
VTQTLTKENTNESKESLEEVELKLEKIYTHNNKGFFSKEENGELKELED